MLLLITAKHIGKTFTIIFFTNLLTKTLDCKTECVTIKTPEPCQLKSAMVSLLLT